MRGGRHRREGSRTGMFVRLLLRATLVRRGRALTALMAVVIASCAAAAMMNLYADVQAKLRKEFRSYGANIVVVAKDGQVLPADALAKADAVLGARGTAVPFGYTVARTANGTPMVLAGTDFSRAQKINSFWSVTGWPKTTAQALVGIRAASVISSSGNGFDLTVNGKTIHLAQAGVLKTGGDEDSRVYVSLDDFTAATGLSASTIEIGATGSPDEIRGMMEKMGAALPTADVEPIRQIMEGEARVLGKTRSTLLAAILVIIATAALCMLATLTAWVLERRKDFAVMKALGASNTLVNGFFAAEAAAIGALGAVLGFVLGIGVAEWIGRANFHAAVVPRFGIFPAVFFGSVGVALVSAIVPISLLRRVQPAVILRGE